MKKIFSMLLAVVLVLGMTVTAFAQQDAMALYTEMNEAMERVKAMEADISMTMTMSMEGQAVNAYVNGRFSALMETKTDVEMEMSMSMRIDGFPDVDKTHIYYKDGYMYQTLEGVLQKTKMDITELMRQSGLEAMGMELTRDAIVRSSVSDVEGGKQLNLVLSGKKMSEMMGAIIGGQMAGMGVEGVSMTFGDIDCAIVMGEDRLPVSQKVKMTMSIEAEGELVDFAVDAAYDYTGFNNFFALKMPAGWEKALEY